MDAVLRRRSIRKYTGEPVSDDQVRRLLEAAMAAPSAGDERPWHFVVIRDPQLRDGVQAIHPYAHMVPQADLAILVCGDETLEQHKGYWVQDCSAATENLLVEAVEQGLGAVWLGIHPIADRVEGFRRLLGIPKHVIPFALVAVGHPAEQKPPADRYDPRRVHRDRW